MSHHLIVSGVEYQFNEVSVEKGGKERLFFSVEFLESFLIGRAKKQTLGASSNFCPNRRGETSEKHDSGSQSLC